MAYSLSEKMRREGRSGLVKKLEARKWSHALRIALSSAALFVAVPIDGGKGSLEKLKSSFIL